MARVWKSIVFSIVTLLTAGTPLLGAPYQLSYSGRLTDAAGKPLNGNVDLKVNFFRSELGNDDVGVVVPHFQGVQLSEGMFQIAIALAASDFHLIFNGVDDTWIQLTELGRNEVYPRQRYSATPYALKVPVDNKAITYDGNGQLTLKVTGGTAGQLLTTDGAGNLSWTAPGGGGDMLAAANLSDVDDVAQARANLGLQDGATADFGTGANDVARGNHTHAAAAITDFNAAVAAAPAVTANTAKTSYPSADATKVGLLTVTQSVDLDAMKTVTAGVADLSAVTNASGARSNLGLAALATKTEVGSGDITDGSIVNDDISASAAISGSKINPDFGSQNITTTGVISGNGSGLTQLTPPPGYLLGAFVQYLDSTRVTITEGVGENNGKRFEIAAPITHTVSSLTTAADMHYIYINDAASTYPGGVVIVDSTTEPTWNAAKSGWYNGNNRCLGAVYSPNASATIKAFQNLDNTIHFVAVQLQNDGTSNDAWHDTSADENELIPVFAKSVTLQLCGVDTSSIMNVFLRPKGQTTFHIQVSGYYSACFMVKSPVYYSDRSLQFNGSGDDDSLIDIFLRSYEISR